MPTYKDSIVAVGRLLRPKAGEPRRYEVVAAPRDGEEFGRVVVSQRLQSHPDQ